MVYINSTINEYLNSDIIKDSFSKDTISKLNNSGYERSAHITCVYYVLNAIDVLVKKISNVIGTPTTYSVMDFRLNDRIQDMTVEIAANNNTITLYYSWSVGPIDNMESEDELLATILNGWQFKVKYVKSRDYFYKESLKQLFKTLCSVLAS